MEIQFTLYSKEEKKLRITCMSLRILLPKEGNKYFVLIFTIHSNKVNTF